MMKQKKMTLLGNNTARLDYATRTYPVVDIHPADFL